MPIALARGESRQPRPGFELGSPITFPTQMTITPRPPHLQVLNNIEKNNVLIKLDIFWRPEFSNK